MIYTQLDTNVNSMRNHHSLRGKSTTRVKQVLTMQNSKVEITNVFLGVFFTIFLFKDFLRFFLFVCVGWFGL